MVSSGDEEDDWGARKGGTKILYCEVCDVEAPSFEALQDHFGGSRHRKKLEVAGMSTSLTDLVERPKNIDIWNKVVKCLLCKVILLGSDCMLHRKSSDHQKKICCMSERNQDFYGDISNCFKAVKVDDEELERKRATRFYCKMCELELSGKDHLDLHLRGKKHQKKARWLYVGGGDQKQVWCSLCKVFVNNIEELNRHFSGKHHIKVLKRSGVDFNILLDSYGEGVVGNLDPVQQQRLSSSSRHHSSDYSSRSKPHYPSHLDSPSRKEYSPPPHGHSSRTRHRSMDDHVSASSQSSSSKTRHQSYNSVTHSPSRSDYDSSARSDHSASKSKMESQTSQTSEVFSPPLSPKFSPKSSSSMEEDFILPKPTWTSMYTELPEYNRRRPRMLREARSRNAGEVVYHYPLLAVGNFIDEMKVDDPRFSEMEEKIHAATREREAKEREASRKERDPRRRDSGGWERRSYGSNRGRRGSSSSSRPGRDLRRTLNQRREERSVRRVRGNHY